MGAADEEATAIATDTDTDTDTPVGPSDAYPFAGSRGRGVAFEQLTYWVDVPVKEDPAPAPAPASGGGVGSSAWATARRALGALGVGRRTQRLRILHDVSGYADPGTLTAIMGPSGSGKTTLLNLVAGYTRVGAFAGTRYFDGCSLAAGEYTAIMRRQGYVLQTDAFLEQLTVRQTLMYAALLRMPGSVPVEAKARAVQQLLEDVGLERAAEAKVGGVSFKGISGGQMRRLCRRAPRPSTHHH